jgi:arginyl-tRNA synthetase
MENGDEEALGVWSRLRAMSIEKYKEVYKRLNIQFDVYGGESQVNEEMIRAFNLLEEKGLLEESEGCKIVNLEKYKLGKVVVQKKDGTTLYITRDLGTAIQRFEKFNFSKMYYIIGSQQDLHCKQFFKILELLGFEWVKNCHHINFGMVAGMSTRAGTVVFLDSILNETRDKMHEVMKRNEEKYAQVENPESVADTIGMSAVIVQDMSARRILNYDFDWERMFSFEGDTGAYLQYAHARLCSIERKVSFEVNPNANTALLTEKEAIELIDVISKYPETIQTATQKFEPCTIVNYALKLSHSVSSCFEALNVMNAEKDVAEARLLLFWCAKVTLNNALRIIGLVPLERM